MTKPKPPSDPVGLTLAHYNAHAEEFIERTVNLSMEHLYRPFLELLPPGGRILDAGCGSGRDAVAFSKRRFDVTAFDGSAVLARLASERTGQTVRHLTFDQIPWDKEFDGVWASASLLHLPSDQLDATLARLARSLRPSGVLFVSMKAGTFEGEREGRWFKDTDAAGLRERLADTRMLEVLNIWETEETRGGRPTRWVNALSRRTG